MLWSSARSVWTRPLEIKPPTRPPRRTGTPPAGRWAGRRSRPARPARTSMTTKAAHGNPIHPPGTCRGFPSTATPSPELPRCRRHTPADAPVRLQNRGTRPLPLSHAREPGTKVHLPEGATRNLRTSGEVRRRTPGCGGVCGQSADKSRRPDPVHSRIRPLTCYFVVAGAGFEPATSGL